MRVRNIKTLQGGTLDGYYGNHAYIIVKNRIIPMPLNDLEIITVKRHKSNIPTCTEKQFLELWEIYPKERRIDKEKCLQKYKNIDSNLHSTIIKSITILQSTDKWKEGYIPNLTTFINQKRWEGVLDSNKLITNNFITI